MCCPVYIFISVLITVLRFNQKTEECVIIDQYINLSEVNTLSNIYATWKQKIWLVGLLIVCFMLCTGFQIKTVYAVDSTAISSTQDITLNDEDLMKNAEEKVSVDDIADSYKKLANKLHSNESKQEAAIVKHEKEVQAKKAEKERKRKRKLCKNIIQTALSKKGSHYVWGATGPNVFDCSGLTLWAYRQNGIYIPRVAASQAQYGQKVSKRNLQTGDLLFFRTDKSSNRISHVGMYIGDGKMVHAPTTGDVVKVSSIYSAFWSRTYAWSCRYI